MANLNEAAVAAHAARAPYASDMKKLYGDGIFRDTQRAFAIIGEALEAFQQTPELFSPFTSKYDAFLKGKVRLSPQEERGLGSTWTPTRETAFAATRIK